MKVQLNVEAVEQLESIMEKMNYKSHQHALQVMLSTITNNLKKKMPRRPKTTPLNI